MEGCLREEEFTSGDGRNSTVVDAVVLRPDALCANLSFKTPILPDSSFHLGQDSQCFAAHKKKTNLIMNPSSVVKKKKHQFLLLKPILHYNVN